MVAWLAAAGPASDPPGPPPPMTCVETLAQAGYRIPVMTAFRGPRRTVRLRLTALYVGLFLASAACLLVITYFLVAQQLPGRPRGAAPSPPARRRATALRRPPRR